MTRSRPRTAALAATATHLVGGTIGVPLAFGFAYAFALEVTTGRHVAFVLGVVVVAGLTRAVATRTVVRELVHDRRLRARIATSTAMVVYGVALAIGILVSLAHEDQNSVTADQPDLPFVLLVVAGLALAALGVRATARAIARGA